MLRRIALIAALAAAPTLAQGKGAIDWNRRVLIGHGQGAPDLNSPSVAVARLGAERAAKLDAFRNALESLKGMQLQSGGSVGSLLQDDETLTGRVEGTLKGVKPIKTRYFSDGGVTLDIEVPLDDLDEALVGVDPAALLAGHETRGSEPPPPVERARSPIHASGSV